jgi:hypothetical protein
LSKGLARRIANHQISAMFTGILLACLANTALAQSEALESALRTSGAIWNYAIDYWIEEDIVGYLNEPRPKGAPDTWTPSKVRVEKTRPWMANIYYDRGLRRSNYATDYSPLDQPFSWDSVRSKSSVNDGSMGVNRQSSDYYVVSRDAELWGAPPISPLMDIEGNAKIFRLALTRSDFEISERMTDDGSIEFELRSVGLPEDIVRVWGVDPERGFSTRHVRLIDAEGRTLSDIQVIRNVEVSPGVWAPVEATSEFRGPADSEHSMHLVVVNATYNDPDMDPDIFRIDIPPDARVYDADLNLTIQNPPPPPRERPVTFEEVVYRETEKRMEASEARRRESGGVQVVFAETEPSSAFSFFSFGRIAMLIALVIAGVALIRWSYVVGKRIDEAEAA